MGAAVTVATARRRGALGVAAPVVVAVAVGLYLAFLSPLHVWHGEFDLKVYRGAVLWWLHHRPLYSFHRNATKYGFTYPPFAALVMLPWAAVTELTALVLNEFVSALVIVGTTWWLVSPIAARHGWPRWSSIAVAVPLVYLMEPVRETLAYGQVNLYLVALVLVDVAALARGRRFAGVGIGLATAIKLTPGLFIVYLLLTRRLRAATVALGTFLGASLLAAAYDPGTSVQFWTRTVFETSRVGSVDSADNQSLLGLFSRLFGTGLIGTASWLTAAAAVLVVGMTRARNAWRRGDELTGITLAGLTSCLVSPISWTHHLYWIVPAILVLLDVAAGAELHPFAWSRLRERPAAMRGWSAVGAAMVAAVFGLSVVWLAADWNGTIPGSGPAVVLLTNAYVLVLLALVLVLPARRGSGRSGGVVRAPGVLQHP
ncbi:MAG: glycosyltransferase 87 family protein [Blastococcus sp.]